jgi:SAM-dependent methyltransferase
MKTALLDVLADPWTHQPLALEDARWGGQEVVSGRLVNRVDERAYEIINGIPRFVPAESYAASFGLQWQRFAQVQLDSANGANYSRRRFDAEVGWSRTQLEQRWVLEVGCGAGRFAEIAAERAGQLVCLDYSSAVDAAAVNLQRFDNVHIVQGDALHPPFRRRSFDYLYSIGVIQHTAEPLRTLQAVVQLLAPSGQLALTIYGRTWWTPLNGKYVVRRFLNTPALPSERLLELVESSMAVAFPLTDALYRLPVAGRLLRFVIPVANYVEKTEFTTEQRYQEAVLDTFDMLSPAFDQPLTADEVAAALRAAGATELKFISRRPVMVHGRIRAGYVGRER